MKNKKTRFLPLYVIGGIAFLTMVVMIILTYTIWNTTLKVEAAQIDDTQNVRVTWDTSKGVDNVKINVSHKGSQFYSITLSSSKDIMKGYYDVPAFYGKQTVSVTAKKALYSTTRTATVDVSADEYVIAPLVATMPVTLFTLELENITDNYTIPAFVWFERSGAWDWTQLPENVYPMPIANGSSFLNTTVQNMYTQTSAWIKELYEINNTSKFNLYYCDYWCHGAVQATYANGIPEENFKIFLLSDGSASASAFNKNFNDDATFDANYASMAQKWSELKTEVASKKKYSTSIFESYKISPEDLGDYAFVMTKEEANIEWWVTRYSGTFAKNTTYVYNREIGGPYKVNQSDEEYVTEDAQGNTLTNALAYTGKLKAKDLKSLLLAIQADAEKEANLKKLYHLSDEMFAEAVAQNKKVMVVLGTYPEDGFEAFVKFTKAYYGDEYVYYYKGHPRYPTQLTPGKQEYLTNLGLIDIDSTIPAEIIFFFNPDAYCTGYDSTTYGSLPDEQVCGIYNKRKATFNPEWKDYIDFYVSAVNTDDATYGSLVEAGSNSFVIEFTDTSVYDTAIYNLTTNTFTYYKHNGENYQVVNA